MKDILVVWCEALAVYFYRFPHHTVILQAHGAVLGHEDNTPEQERAVGALRIMVREGKPLSPKTPIDAQLYSKIVVSGILEEMQ